MGINFWKACKPFSYNSPVDQSRTNFLENSNVIKDESAIALISF